MAGKTNIAWTDYTWNVLRGCSVVSPGCTNCYAMNLAATRLSFPGGPYEGLAEMRNGHPVWTGKVVLVEKLVDQPLRWQKPRRIFVNAMSDLFHESVPDEWLDRIFDVMEQATWHQFQILTKRPERMRDYMISRYQGISMAHGREPGLFWPPSHVWLGTSVEDQRRADERVPILMQTPAVVRFLSIEPMLGPVNLEHFFWRRYIPEDPEDDNLLGGSWEPTQLIHWVITGGESGVRHRPFDVAWARDLRDQCREAGVAFFHKQGGGLRPKTDPHIDGYKHEQFPDVPLSEQPPTRYGTCGGEVAVAV